jgi:hypothetical protein
MKPCKIANKPIVGSLKILERIGAEKALIVTSRELLPGQESNIIALVPSKGKEDKNLVFSLFSTPARPREINS